MKFELFFFITSSRVLITCYHSTKMTPIQLLYVYKYLRNYTARKPPAGLRNSLPILNTTSPILFIEQAIENYPYIVGLDAKDWIINTTPGDEFSKLRMTSHMYLWFRLAILAPLADGYEHMYPEFMIKDGKVLSTLEIFSMLMQCIRTNHVNMILVIKAHNLEFVPFPYYANSWPNILLKNSMTFQMIRDKLNDDKKAYHCDMPVLITRQHCNVLYQGALVTMVPWFLQSMIKTDLIQHFKYPIDSIPLIKVLQKIVQDYAGWIPFDDMLLLEESK